MERTVDTMRVIRFLGMFSLVVGLGLPHTLASAASDCGRFVADVTVPDGTEMLAGQSFDKVWRLANCGDATWDGYRARRVHGSYGPDMVDVPRTPPGSTAELRAHIQAPTVPGEHVATYQMEGAAGAFGGTFTVVISIVDCAAPAVTLPTSGGVLESRRLIVPAQELGGTWCLLSAREDVDYTVKYRDAKDYAVPRVTSIAVSVAPDTATAEGRVGLVLIGVADAPGHGARVLEVGPRQTGDGQAVGWVMVEPDHVAKVGSAFRVGPVVAVLEVGGAEDQVPDLKVQAARIGGVQEQRMRAVLALTPAPPPPPEPTVISADAVAQERAAARAYAITDLGGIPEFPQAIPTAIGPTGLVVGSASLSDGGLAQQAFEWDGRTMMQLAGVYRPAGIDAGGRVVGSAPAQDDSERDISHAAVWEAGILTDLGTLTGGQCEATAINAGGQVVGMCRSPVQVRTNQGGGTITSGPVQVRPFLWQDGTMIDLVGLGGDISEAYAINDSEQVVGMSFLPGAKGIHAFLWQGGAVRDLGTLGGAASEARGINNSGQVVGSADTLHAGSHAFLWNEGVMYDLGSLGGRQARANSVNRAGLVVGSSFTPSGIEHAFLWDEGVMSDLNDYLPAESGWELSHATAVNDAGQIIGSGKLNGEDRGFVLTPVEVSTVRNGL